MMQNLRTGPILLTLFVLPLPAFAQQHAASQAVLDQMLAERVRQTMDDREAVQRILQNEQVRKVAEDVGFELKRADAAVATLDEDEVAALSAQARAVNDALAGGQNVTLSTTWIIIGLLVLILLIVAI